MRKYILASDYDGTLCQNGRVSSNTISAIKRWRSQGNLFGVVTGRDYHAYDFFRMHDNFDFDFLILNNGAQAVGENGGSIFTDAVGMDDKSHSCALIAKFVNRCLELTKTRCTISMDNHSLVFCGDSYITNEVHCEMSELKYIDRFVAAHTICETECQASYVTSVLNDEYGEYLRAAQNGWNIDITAKGIDKASGIYKLADMLGVHKSNIWCVGDNFNDIAMIKRYHGCAILGSPQEVIESAEYVCENVEQMIDFLLQQQETG